MLCAGPLATAAACARPSVGINSPTAATERRIEAALREGRITEARDVAIGYERRLPGPASWSLLGRASWRLGEVAPAEEFHRRAARDGHPEGLLGLARVLAARGEYAAALEVAAPTLRVGQMAGRAASFVGGLYWRTGDVAAAADTFEYGAAAAGGETATRLAALATAVRRVENGGEAIRWRGSAGAASTEVADGATWVRADIGGTAARLRVDPMRWRSSVTPQFAARLGAEVEDRELVQPVSLAGIAARRVPLAILGADLGDGVLGFDLLVDLRWRWSPVTGALFVGRADSREESAVFQHALATTHWVGVRTIVDGLALQLLLVPRIGARAEVASVARDGVATISATARRRQGHDGDAVLAGETVPLLTRIGGWQSVFDYQVVPETGSQGQVPLSSPVTLGAAFVRGWVWRWSPDSRQLALIEVPPAVVTDGS